MAISFISFISFIKRLARPLRLSLRPLSAITTRKGTTTKEREPTEEAPYCGNPYTRRDIKSPRRKGTGESALTVGTHPKHPPRKDDYKMNLSQNIEELKNVRQWVNYIRIWNATKNGGRGGYDKPPINPGTLRDGMTNNPATWTDYDTAAARIRKTATHKDTKHKDAQGVAPIIEAPVEGAGLVLAGGYCGVDLDDVIDDAGNVADFARRIIDTLDTYTEISPSGHGLHALLYCGDLLEAGEDFGKQFLLKADPKDPAGVAITDSDGKQYELEVYFYVHGGRYFTVTGNAYRDKPISRTKGAKLRAIYDYFVKRTDAYREAQRAAATPSTVGTSSRTTGRAATGEDDRKMLESALAAIDPGALDFGEWAAIMTALKVLGFSLDEAEAFSASRGNPKNDPRTNAYRWAKFHFKKGDNDAAGIIINTAKRFSWTPAEAFDDDKRAEYGRSLYSEEARHEYGRSLHTEEERREYGRQLHAHDFDDMEESFHEWRAAHGSGTQPAEIPPQQQTTAPRATNKPGEISLDDFHAWKRKKG